MVGGVEFETYSLGLSGWEGAQPAPVTEDREGGWGLSSFSAEPDGREVRPIQTAAVDWGTLAAIGVVALAGGIARLIHSHRVRKRDAARIEQILSSGVRRVAENSKVGNGWLVETQFDRQVRPDGSVFVPAVDNRLLDTFSHSARMLVGDFYMIFDFDRRAATRVGRLAPTSFLMKYWREGNPLRCDWLAKEMEDALHLAYKGRYIEASNKHIDILEPRVTEAELVGGLHSIVAAQLTAQEGHIAFDPDEQAKLFRTARDRIDLAIDAFSSGILDERIGMLDRYGMRDIRKQTKALRFDIDTALREAEGRPPMGTEDPAGLFGRLSSGMPLRMIKGGVAAKFSSLFMMPGFRPATVR